MIPSSMTPAKRYHLAGAPWYFFLLLFPFVGLVSLIACRSPARVGALLVLLNGTLQLSVTCLLGQPFIRYLCPLSFCALITLATIAESGGRIVQTLLLRTRKQSFSWMLAPLALIALATSSASSAEAPQVELNCVSDRRLLVTHFARYGYWPARTIILETQGVRFWLPSGVKGVGQTGLYSYFALAGDFEVSASYELISLPPPRSGYGVTVGLSVDTDGADGSVSLARGYLLTEGSGYVVSWSKPSDDGMHYDGRHYPTQMNRGRLVLRREKKELICLVEDEPHGERHELYRVPFTDRTVRKVRIFADPGGSPTKLEARLANLTFRAEEIAGGIPQREQNTSGWWLLLVFGTGVSIALSFWFWRIRRSKA